ncbi:right-handed parallel beta-helix repeat-containing protein [Streptomyces sp. NPDC060194]|uniref:right-handed parallel beta-helix repeat-containing protein n=1 Tax=Streptomyces sp. NPDC060194 TaxID=3347069 RepID=UPI00365FF7C0
MRYPTRTATAAAVVVCVLSAGAVPAGAASGERRDGRGTYYVSASGSDANDGRSPRSPFRTIQHAADLTRPGDTVQIMNGTYRDTSNEGVVMVRNSGTAGAPITYTNYRNHRPKIAPVTGWNGIVLIGASHIVIDDLEIEGNARNLTLEDATAKADPRKPAYNQNCVVAREGADKLPWSHVTFRNIHAHDCPGGGIATTGGDYITIEDNLVHSNANYAVYANSGISVLAPEAVDESREIKVSIQRNVVHDNESKVKWVVCGCISDGNGIIIDTTIHPDTSGGVYTGRSLIANNISFDNGGSGIHAYKSADVDIVNNTTYLNSRSPALSYPNVGAWGSKDVRVLNNISVARPGKETNFAHDNVNVVYDYNVYWGGLKPRTAGPHDLIADPLLRNPGTDPETADFRIERGSPAGDSGTRFDEVGRDFTGKRRPQGPAYDRGAFELRGRH